MARQFRCLPSVVLGIEDEYTAYCFNEACYFILAKLEADEKPHYIERKTNGEVLEPKSYKSFKDFYKQYGGNEDGS
jgi:hypothetical protein